MDIRRGEVYYLVKENLIGRPAVIVSADEINQTGPNAQCVYISLKPHGDMDTHVDVCMGDDGRFGTAICERVCPVYEDRLGDYMFTLSAEDMRRIDDALRKVFNLGQTAEVSEKTIRRHRWTKAEDAWLLRNYATTSDIEIADRIGVSRAAVTAHYWKLTRGVL